MPSQDGPAAIGGTQARAGEALGHPLDMVAAANLADVGWWWRHGKTGAWPWNSGVKTCIEMLPPTPGKLPKAGVKLVRLAADSIEWSLPVTRAIEGDNHRCRRVVALPASRLDGGVSVPSTVNAAGAWLA